MPEAPDLTVAREVWERRLIGLTIDSESVVRPTVPRNHVPDDLATFSERLSPFRKRGELSLEEIERSHMAAHSVPTAMVGELWKRMDEDVHQKPRDFLQTHNKKDQTCPRCWGMISQIAVRQHITSYCMRCQPGLLIKN